MELFAAADWTSARILLEREFDFALGALRDSWKNLQASNPEAPFPAPAATPCVLMYPGDSGTDFARFGQEDQTEESLRKAVGLAGAVFGPGSREALSLRSRLGAKLGFGAWPGETGRLEEARGLLGNSAGGLKELLGAGHGDALDAGERHVMFLKGYAWPPPLHGPYARTPSGGDVAEGLNLCAEAFPGLDSPECAPPSEPTGRALRYWVHFADLLVSAGQPRRARRKRRPRGGKPRAGRRATPDPGRQVRAVQGVRRVQAAARRGVSGGRSQTPGRHAGGHGGLVL
ncbi:MAG: hypothetical protein LBQ12_03645 [Deltaproteobacteria bacterium]|nr:hypothetical protein [Deltaproteobacteria bacterium]